MDAHTLRRALFDLYRFSSKDFHVKGSGTGYLVSIARQSPFNAKPPLPFLELIDVSTHKEDGTIDEAKVRVVLGDVGSAIPDVFSPGDDPVYTFTPVGDGEVWSYFQIDPTSPSGEGTTNTIDHGASKPESDIATGEYYTSIGSYSVGEKSVTVANSCHGPITAQVCMQYYTAPQLYWLTMVPSP